MTLTMPIGIRSDSNRNSRPTPVKPTTAQSASPTREPSCTANAERKPPRTPWRTVSAKTGPGVALNTRPRTNAVTSSVSMSFLNASISTQAPPGERNRERVSGGDFEESCRAHAAADAHRHHDVSRPAAFTLDERVADQAAAGHAVRMADRNCAAIDVEPAVGNAEAVATVDHLHSERFVQLPEADVVEPHAGPLEEFWDREHRTDAHLVGLATGDRKAAEDAHRLEPPFPRDAVAHDDADGGAVGELAGVAGGDHAALDRRFDFGHAFVGRVRTNALVLGRDHFVDGFAAFVLVHRLHLGGDRHDLVAELPLAPRLGGLRLALHAVAVLTLPTDVVPLRDRFR